MHYTELHYYTNAVALTTCKASSTVLYDSPYYLRYTLRCSIAQTAITSWKHQATQHTALNLITDKPTAFRKIRYWYFKKIAIVDFFLPIRFPTNFFHFFFFWWNSFTAVFSTLHTDHCTVQYPLQWTIRITGQIEGRNKRSGKLMPWLQFTALCAVLILIKSMSFETAQNRDHCQCTPIALCEKPL